MLSRFHLIPERNGQTDRRMDKDRFAILISRISMLTRDKNDLENEVNKKRFEHTTYAIKPEHLAHWAMAAVGDIGLKVQYKLAHVRYTPARA